MKIKRLGVSDYDVIGFDMDFCLINYNKKRLIRLQYEFTSKFLINKKGYTDILHYDQIEQDIINLYFKCVVDLKYGTLLKMGTHGEILRVFKGNHRLGFKEI